MESIIIDSPELTDGTFDYEDESYFLQTYVPLSSFPTPPPSTSDGGTRPQSSASYQGLSDEDCPLIGPSVHLSNLIPSAVSFLDPSPSLVLSILKRAQLPVETLALAICILDALNSRFANIWRRSIPLSTPSSSQNTSYTFSPPHQTPSIDSIRPEIIILSALILAQKFLDDEQSPTSFWAERIGHNRWTTDQINATEFAIMENLQWRILPLWNEERLAEALEDMEMAGKQAQAMRLRQARSCNNSMAENRGTSMAIPMMVNTGQAVQNKETKLWTPTETPNYGTGDCHELLSLETRMAFGASAQDQELLSPRSFISEPFPAYTEPILGSDGLC